MSKLVFLLMDCTTSLSAGWSSSATSNTLCCSTLMFSSATSSSAAISFGTRGLCHRYDRHHKSCRIKANDAREQQLRFEPRRRLQRLKVILLIRRPLADDKKVGAHGCPLMKNNWRSVRPALGVNLEISAQLFHHAFDRPGIWKHETGTS